MKGSASTATNVGGIGVGLLTFILQQAKVGVPSWLLWVLGAVAVALIVGPWLLLGGVHMAKKRRKKGLSQAERDRRARQAGQVAPGIPHVELFHFGEGSKIRGTIKNVKAKIRGATGGIASADKDADIDIDWENIEHDVSTQDSTQLSEEPDDSARGRETDGQAS